MSRSSLLTTTSFGSWALYTMIVLWKIFKEHCSTIFDAHEHEMSIYITEGASCCQQVAVNKYLELNMEYLRAALVCYGLVIFNPISTKLNGCEYCDRTRNGNDWFNVKIMFVLTHLHVISIDYGKAIWNSCLPFLFFIPFVYFYFLVLFEVCFVRIYGNSSLHHFFSI